MTPEQPKPLVIPEKWRKLYDDAGNDVPAIRNQTMLITRTLIEELAAKDAVIAGAQRALGAMTTAFNEEFAALQERLTTARRDAMEEAVLVIMGSPLQIEAGKIFAATTLPEIAKRVRALSAPERETK
jgi:hypothetical protein